MRGNLSFVPMSIAASTSVTAGFRNADVHVGFSFWNEHKEGSIMAKHPAMAQFPPSTNPLVDVNCKAIMSNKCIIVKKVMIIFQVKINRPRHDC